VSAPVPFDFERLVIGLGEQIRMRPPPFEQPSCNKKFLASVLPAFGEIRHRDGANLFQQPLPNIPIHGPAIVGVDQAVVPQLATLIHIGHARHGQLEHELRERGDRAEPSERCDEIMELREERTFPRRVERGADKASESRLIGSIWVAPARLLLALAHGLYHVGLYALTESLNARHVVRSEIRRPCPEQCLIEEVFDIAFRNDLAIELNSTRTVEPEPLR